MSGNVYVIGSINMDVVARAARHPRKGETVLGDDLSFLPGGKGANQAVAARRAGAVTYMVGMLGEDSFGAELRSFLESEQLDLSFLRTHAGTPTGTALITVADAENTIVVIPGANGRLTPAHVNSLPLRKEDIVVAQFETPQDTVLAAFEHAHSIGAMTVLNPAPAATPIQGLLAITDVLIVNESELSWLATGASVEEMSHGEAIHEARKLRDHAGQAIIVTLGANGAVVLTEKEVLSADGHKVAAVDTTGAGDCFVGNLTATLAGGAELAAALEAGNRAASICVQGMGAARSMPHADTNTQLAA